ncbi:MAG TPA: A/G-specific adenine glycosylase [Burkholderiales bacterium]|nr:A/G-specific adenine glycosylase [Burkholderiales bacterium]
MTGFAATLIAWHRRHGRHHLPWQGTRDPYAIWISEIMLQQTQVATVIPYYQRFLARFPDISTLAGAALDDVLALWSGLGYYSRARNLHRAAEIIVREHGGRFPRAVGAVLGLPGIGRSTAAAICAFAYGTRVAILDGNVKRVLARYFAVAGYPGEPRVATRLWDKAEALLPRRDIRAYTQAVMDLGAGICTRRRPRCAACPLVSQCRAYRGNRTAELPAPRPRTALPKRETVMALLEREGRIALEKRPAAGIWGALWCLPEIDAGEDLHAACERRFGVRIDDAVRLPVVEHGFTHFRLTIRPWHCRASEAAPRALEARLAWMTLDEALKAALPAPVRRIALALRARSRPVARAGNSWKDEDERLERDQSVA